MQSNPVYSSLRGHRNDILPVVLVSLCSLCILFFTSPSAQAQTASPSVKQGKAQHVDSTPYSSDKEFEITGGGPLMNPWPLKGEKAKPVEEEFDVDFVNGAQEPATTGRMVKPQVTAGGPLNKQ